jgi:EthD domain
MLKFMLAAQRRPETAQERYFYEWGIIHVSLMLQTPSVMDSFRRYVQHYSVSGIDNDMLIHPLSPMNWDNMADHVVENYEAIGLPFNDQDYPNRMQPHKFGSDNFAVELLDWETLYEEPGFYAGGVKLIHWLRKKPELSYDEFNARWREHGKLLVETAPKGLIRKLVIDKHVPMDPAVFKGTLFEFGNVGHYAGVEELWFRTVEDVTKLRKDSELFEALRASYDSFVANDDTFSMVTTERVIYDFITPGHLSPKASVLIPGTLEHEVDKQGYKGWNVPGWDKDLYK